MRRKVRFKSNNTRESMNNFLLVDGAEDMYADEHVHDLKTCYQENAPDEDKTENFRKGRELEIQWLMERTAAEKTVCLIQQTA